MYKNKKIVSIPFQQVHVVKHHSPPRLRCIWLWNGESDSPLNVFNFLYVDDECHFYSAENLPRVCNDVMCILTVRDRFVVKSPTLPLYLCLWVEK